MKSSLGPDSRDDLVLCVLLVDCILKNSLKRRPKDSETRLQRALLLLEYLGQP